MSVKRPGDASSALIKRQRVEDDPALQQIIVASDGNSANKGALCVFKGRIHLPLQLAS